MIIDFSDIGVIKEQPTLVLCNADGSAIQTLGYAFNLKVELCYNEVSTVTFDIPAYVDGEKTPHYDDISGMRIINMVGWGRFILTNPSVNDDGIKEIKSCKAYSLEYELTYKKVYFSEATYNFWNPLSPDGTVLGMIANDLPSWTVGTVDSDLIGKYRTLSAENVNIYNFMKSTLQQTFNCIFDFDTYSRAINVRSVSNEAVTKPVYLSMNNLVKEIEVEEDTENIVTVLDVNGGEDVDIRMVNPMGTNKIYNLDYFMNTSHFSRLMIDKWNAWKQNFEVNQRTYYNLSVERMLKTSAILTEKSALNTLENLELAKLLNERSVYIEFLAQITDKDSADYEDYQNKLNVVNGEISEKRSEIDAQNDIISALEAEDSELVKELTDIQNSVNFNRFFTEDELVILDRYFKEDSIEESTFVVSEVNSYSNSDISNSISDAELLFENCNVIKTEIKSGKILYNITGGTFEYSNGEASLTADLVNALLEQNTDDDSFILSAFLNKGTIDEVSFPSGCISINGTNASVFASGLNSEDFSASVSLNAGTGRMYFTRNTTDYERYSVSWDLYEYGKKNLESLAYPSYTFKISSANFLTIDAFASFTRQLELGQKIYLNIDERIIQPIFIGAEIDFEDPSSLSLQFSDKYTSSDCAFQLVDLLEQSISMGKSVDANKLSYSSFIDSGASTKVKEFMDSALDVAKNSILSSSGQGVSWDNSGFHLRKYIDSANHDIGFEDEQIWMINNSIVFTDDGWQTAKMAIGKIIDENIATYSETADTIFVENKVYYYKDDSGTYRVWDGTKSDWSNRPILYEKDATAYGIVAPYIVGTMLAGQNLVITTKDGSFRVDSSGVHINSMKFYITHDGSTYDTTLSGELQRLTDADNEITQTLSGCITNDGYLKASQLKGSINAVQSTMQNSSGNVLFDDDGIWLLNAATKEASTTAIWMNERGILFGSGSKGHINTEEGEEGAWTWTTAIAHDGIIADAMATKVLSSFEINSGSINIGNGNFVVDEGGNLTAQSGTFSGTVSGANFKDSSGNSMMSADYKFSADYLNLKGLAITNAAGDTTFSIDANGNISMRGDIELGAGSVINWDTITSRGSNNPITIASDAQATAETASSTASDAADDIIKLANGEYVDKSTTFIDGTNIYSPNITAGVFTGSKFIGAEYWDKCEIAQLTLSTQGTNNYADLIYYSVSHDHEMFKIYDPGYWDNAASIYLYGNEIGYSTEDTFYAQGNWDFGKAEVTNLNISAVACFG